MEVIEAQGEAQALELVNRAIQDQPLLLHYFWIKSLPERVRVVVVPNRSEKPAPRTKAALPELQRIPWGAMKAAEVKPYGIDVVRKFLAS